MPSAFAQNFYQAVRYRADLSHAEMLHHIKGRSSRWINRDGYGGFG